MTSFSNVTVDAKANVYFDGNVVSHTVHFADGSKKTLGLIYPGKFHFGTAAPERMEIIAGNCKVMLDGTSEALTIEAGSAFDVPATAASPSRSTIASANTSARSCQPDAACRHAEDPPPDAAWLRRCWFPAASACPSAPTTAAGQVP